MHALRKDRHGPAPTGQRFGGPARSACRSRSEGLATLVIHAGRIRQSAGRTPRNAGTGHALPTSTPLKGVHATMTDPASPWHPTATLPRTRLKAVR